MVTIKEVAREAGVSTATVSRYIHNSPRVLPETKAVIEAAIQKLDYHPNHLARQFRTQRTGILLVLIPEVENTFYHEILSGIEHVAQKNGYHVMISQIHNRVSQEEYFFECLSQKQVDGIITFSDRLTPDKIEEYAASYPVVVACRYYKGKQLAGVTIDNEKASRDITTYMLNLGHRDICYLAGNTDILLYQDRLRGFITAMRERQLPLRESLIQKDLHSLRGGYDAVMRLLEEGEHFTALIASGDTLAIGAIQALRDHGMRVPEDVAVAGFDDIELSSLFSPSLTTIRQPKKLIGNRAAEKLLGAIEGKVKSQTQDILPYELVVRESSGSFIGTP